MGRNLLSLGEKNNLKPVQLATFWAKDQPGVTLPLIGPKTLEQLNDYLPVMDMKLKKSLIKKCDLLVPQEMLRPIFITQQLG
ncbi:MAG: hypothetical protein CM1200mP1_15250 [Candidatus Neomarinimicrobiota bacterium]|nr:MAG: hypothetical protein CM1200mP1_15250 [Candidatus Neomarinimicrobiota bacterium]